MAWAHFADALAMALQQLATELRAEATTATTDGEPTTRGRVAETQTVYAAVGERQGQVLLALLHAPEWGMTTREVADAIGYDTANAWNVLRRLQTMGLVELVPNRQPQRWRLADAGRAWAESVTSDGAGGA